MAASATDVRPWLAALVLLLAAPAVQAAGVYKWVARDGTVHFDDKTVTQPRLTQADLDHRIVDARPQEPAPPAFARQVEQRCDVSRVRLGNYRAARELYGEDPAGNVYRLSPRQVALSIAEVERDEATYCGTTAADALYAKRLAEARKQPPDTAAR